MLEHETGTFQALLPALTVRVDAAQHMRAKNETANCSTGQADHSDLSEGSSAVTPPLCSPGTQLSVQMNSVVSSCPPAKLLSETLE